MTGTRTVLSVFGVQPVRIGGIEMYARELSAQLNGHGWRSVLCFDAPAPDAVRSFLEGPNVALDVLPGAASTGWRTHRELAHLIRCYRPQILHLAFTGFVNLFSWIARANGVRQIFFWDQGSHPPSFVAARAPAWKRLATRAINWPLSRVLCISRYNQECLRVQDVFPPSRIHLLYNAVDLKRPPGDGAAFRSRYGIPPRRAVVLQVSWIIPEKGIPDLLDAAPRVLAEFPDVHFVIAGEGRYREEYEAWVAGRGLSGNITFTGRVGDPLAEGVYDAADVVCQVSRWQEAFGWTIAEGMARGRPIVATRVGGIPEIVADGESGLLAPPGDAAAIAENLLVLLADPVLRGRMGAKGRQIVEERFNLERNVAELLTLYGITR